MNYPVSFRKHVKKIRLTMESIFSFHAEQLSEVINETNLEELKDQVKLDIFQILLSLLKLCCMKLMHRIPINGADVILNKCNMGNSFSTLWSGKTLNNVHMEHLGARIAKIREACEIVSECLDIEKNKLSM